MEKTHVKIRNRNRDRPGRQGPKIILTWVKMVESACAGVTARMLMMLQV